jgi:competence protein ComEA
MLKILTRYLMIFTSLFMLSTSIHTFASDKDVATKSDKTTMSDGKAMDNMQVAEKININQASSEELSMIKGIGPSKAQAIVDYRDSIGKFKSTDELINVKGIGKGTLEKIEPFISL